MTPGVGAGSSLPWPEIHWEPANALRNKADWHQIALEMNMIWKTPVTIEISLGAEINSYACATYSVSAGVSRAACGATGARTTHGRWPREAASVRSNGPA